VAVAPDLNIIPFRVPSDSGLFSTGRTTDTLNKIKLVLNQVEKINALKRDYIAAVSISIGVPMWNKEQWNI
jgi:hypothetical protein